MGNTCYQERELLCPQGLQLLGEMALQTRLRQPGMHIAS